MPRTVLMISATRARTLLIDCLKVLAVLAAFLAIQEQIRRVRYDIYGGRSGLAQAETRSQAELGQARESMETALAECAFEIAEARGQIESALHQLRADQDEFLRAADAKAQDIEGSLFQRLEKERVVIEERRAALEAGTARIDNLCSRLLKAPQLMKRRMIQPTVQLKGNGTVGSGVIIYCERQPEAEKGSDAVFTTFVLTAYHVVLEVMGDAATSGLVEEVHVFRDPDRNASEVHPAKLVLFDRARDVALLRLSSTKQFAEVVELTPREEIPSIDIFARAYAVGCPLGNRPLPTLGEVSSKSKLVSDQVFWMLSAPTFFGNSGGGVYLADTCRLIGVSSMIYTYGKSHPAVVPHLGLFVPLDAVYRWLDAEGFAFVHQRRAIPKEMVSRLAHVEKKAVEASHSSGRVEEGGQ